MANKSKHLKENVKQKNSKKRADKKAALKVKNLTLIMRLL